MDVQQWQTAVGLIGLPAVLVLGICYAGWTWGWWVLTEVVKPSAVRFWIFLEHVMEAITKLTNSSESICEQMRQQGEKISDHGEQLTSHGKTLEEIRGLLRK